MNTDNPIQSSNTGSQGTGEVFVVGRGFHLVGTVRGSGQCVIDGSVDGTVESDSIKVNAGGFISGDLKCNVLEVTGRVQGNVEAQDIKLKSQASVEGSVNYTNLAMESGAVVDGELRCTKIKAPRPEPIYFFKLPENIRRLISESKSVDLKMSDGNPLPPWISFQDMGVSVDRSKFQDHLRAGGTRDLTLRVDGHAFVVNIP